jgi:hypothetical protein
VCAGYVCGLLGVCWVCMWAVGCVGIVYLRSVGIFGGLWVCSSVRGSVCECGGVLRGVFGGVNGIFEGCNEVYLSVVSLVRVCLEACGSREGVEGSV